MPIKTEMQSLTQGLLRSFEERTEEIAQLREWVNTLLQDFGAERREVHTARVAGARELRAELAQEAAELRHGMGTMLREVHTARTAAAGELRAELAKGAAGLREGVNTLLQDFGADRAAGARELRAELAKGAAGLRQGVGTMLQGFDRELREVGAERAGAREEWGKLTATMQSKRGGVTVAVKPLIEDISEEEAVARAELAEMSPELMALRQQVFEYLANHPDGIRMTELEQQFGLARLQMAKVIRGLMDANKVVKRGLVYFAI